MHSIPSTLIPSTLRTAVAILTVVRSVVRLERAARLVRTEARLERTAASQVLVNQEAARAMILEKELPLVKGLQSTMSMSNTSRTLLKKRLTVRSYVIAAQATNLRLLLLSIHLSLQVPLLL